MEADADSLERRGSTVACLSYCIHNLLLMYLFLSDINHGNGEPIVFILLLTISNQYRSYHQSNDFAE